MNNTETLQHATCFARHLRKGDVLVGSGFTVTAHAWAGTRTPKGKVYVEGFYPGSEPKRYEWSAGTVVSLV
jgi:hypothetical protein